MHAVGLFVLPRWWGCLFGRGNSCRSGSGGCSTAHRRSSRHGRTQIYFHSIILCQHIIPTMCFRSRFRIANNPCALYVQCIPQYEAVTLKVKVALSRVHSTSHALHNFLHDKAALASKADGGSRRAFWACCHIIPALNRATHCTLAP